MTADRWAEHARRIAEALELGLDDCDPENDFSPGQVYVDAQASLAALLDELARLRQDVLSAQSMMEGYRTEAMLGLSPEDAKTLRAERDAAETRQGTRLVDAICHYRTLAIELGAKPEQMLNEYDRDLAVNGPDPEIAGWNDMPDAWEKVDAAETRAAELEAKLNSANELMTDMATAADAAEKRAAEAEQERNETRGEANALRQLLDAERAKIAALSAYSETDDWLSHRFNQEWDRAERAEARVEELTAMMHDFQADAEVIEAECNHYPDVDIAVIRQAAEDSSARARAVLVRDEQQ